MQNVACEDLVGEGRDRSPGSRRLIFTRKYRNLSSLEPSSWWSVVNIFHTATGDHGLCPSIHDSKIWSERGSSAFSKFFSLKAYNCSEQFLQTLQKILQFDSFLFGSHPHGIGGDALAMASVMKAIRLLVIRNTSQRSRNRSGTRLKDCRDRLTSQTSCHSAFQTFVSFYILKDPQLWLVLTNFWLVRFNMYNQKI